MSEATQPDRPQSATTPPDPARQQSTPRVMEPKDLAEIVSTCAKYSDVHFDMTYRTRGHSRFVRPGNWQNVTGYVFEQSEESMDIYINEEQNEESKFMNIAPFPSPDCEYTRFEITKFNTTVKRARRVELDQPKRGEPVRRIEVAQSEREIAIVTAQAVQDARLKKVTKPIQGGEGLRTAVAIPTELNALSPHIWFEKLLAGADKKELLGEWTQSWDDLAKTLGAVVKFGERREAYLAARRNTVVSIMGEHPRVKDDWRLIYRNVSTALHELVLAATNQQKVADIIQRDLRLAVENNYVDIEEILLTLRDSKSETTQSAQASAHALPLADIVQKQQEVLVNMGKRLDDINKSLNELRGGQGGPRGGRGNHSGRGGWRARGGHS